MDYLSDTALNNLPRVGRLSPSDSSRNVVDEQSSFPSIEAAEDQSPLKDWLRAFNDVNIHREPSAFATAMTFAKSIFGRQSLGTPLPPPPAAEDGQSIRERFHRQVDDQARRVAARRIAHTVTNSVDAKMEQLAGPQAPAGAGIVAQFKHPERTQPVAALDARGLFDLTEQNLRRKRAELQFVKTLFEQAGRDFATLWTAAVNREADTLVAAAHRITLAINAGLDPRAILLAELANVPAQNNVNPPIVLENIHQVGRGDRTRRSVETLVNRRTLIDLNEQLRRILSFIRVEIAKGAASRLQHRTLTGATLALFGTTTTRSILAQDNRLANGRGGSWQMRHVVARIWDEFNYVTDPPRADADVRTARREAFVLAAANCINPDGYLVCTMGQAQRLLMTLQGFVDGVDVDGFADGQHVTVSDYITEVYRQHHEELHATEDDDERMQIFDAMYREGQAIFADRERQNSFREQLKELADVALDLLWDPRP